MYIFQRTETIQCVRNVRDRNTGSYLDPDTSFKVSIQHVESREIVCSNQDMVNTGETGKYFYNYTSTGSVKLGKYRVVYTAIHGGQSTIWVDEFIMEEGILT